MSGGKYDLQVGVRTEVTECHAKGFPGPWAPGARHPV